MTQSERKFYVTTITVTVLSEEPYTFDSLHDVWYNSNYGETSAAYTSTSREVGGEEMAKLLTEQGSDPEFFRLTIDGMDLSDEDEEVSPPETDDESADEYDYVQGDLNYDAAREKGRL